MSRPGPRTVVLTGAAHGIGRATALALGARGHRLGLIDRDAEALAGSAEALRAGGSVVAAATADVTDAAALRDAVGAIEAVLGPTDTLVACAGIGGLTLLPTFDPAELRAILEVNVVGVANALAAVLPGMVDRGAGHIVGVSSVASYRGFPWMASYCASKAALATYLEGLRPALKRRGIAVTTVYPGFVRTAMTENVPFRKPVPMLEPEHAARQLVRAVERRPRDHVFPFQAALIMGALRRLPSPVFDWMMDRAGPEALDVDF